MPLICS